MRRFAANVDILIVGAGLTGLMAAHVLKTQNYTMRLVDKGRSVGGRLATRRIGPGRADHGAQFFTVRSNTFERWVQEWLVTGLVYQWSSGWSDTPGEPPEPDGHPRYAVTGGMNALAKHLAHGLPTGVNIQLTALYPAVGGWQAETESGQRFTARSVLLTPPAPQSLALLKAGGTPLTASDQAALERITYAPCVAGLFWIEGPVEFPPPGALQRPEAQITWMADNQRKGISPEARLITVHAGPEYSQQLWELAPTEALTALQEALAEFLPAQSAIKEAQLKRWRYALPTTLHPERYLVAKDLPLLVFAGDAFQEARVEGAALSGLTAGRVLAEQLAFHL